MSLNKTLDRLFDEIRREAKRNPDFADRLDAVLRAHESRRDVDEALIEELQARPQAAGEVAGANASDEAGGAPSIRPPARPDSSAAGGGAKKKQAPRPPMPTPDINPVGLYTREGPDALAAALAPRDREALLALVAEHNLDPGGEAEALEREALADLIVAQAKRRAERDSKLFDY